MAQALFTNNAFSTLASGITDVATSLAVAAADGAKFPNPTGADYFYATLIDTSNNLEIIKVTTRSTDTFTIVRAQEGTTGRAYSAGDRIELRVTAAGLTENVAATAADAVSTAADAVSTAADVVLTGIDVGLTSADAASTAADVIAAAASAAKLTGTSTTSLAIAVASKVFTTQASKFFEAGRWLLATSDADPTNYMHGQVTSYSGTTLTLNVTNIGGSGTFADWTITVAGTRGATGATGATGPLANVVEDTTPQLGGFLDANGNYIQREKGTDIASATPTVPTDGDYFDVTGTTTIATWTVAADRSFAVQFDGALTLTHHATTQDLPGEANITTTAGDVAHFQSTGANTVQCTAYTKADGTAVVSSGGLTIGTAQATTSGTAFNFGSIPAGTTMIVVHFQGVSLSGTDDILVQIGDAGGIETSGYVAASQASTSTAGFIMEIANAALISHGAMVLYLEDAANFTWTASGSYAKATNSSRSAGGYKSLSAELTQLTLTRTGTDAFDAGSVNISYM